MRAMPKTKVCFKCEKRKPVEMFYRHPRMKDGRVGKCKECNKSDVRQNRSDRIDYYRAYDRNRGSRQSAKDIKRYRQNNPIKYGASCMVNNAVRDGKLKKPKRCQECRQVTRLHGHHDDYSKPLEVRWLCPACHHGWHAIHGEGLNG